MDLFVHVDRGPYQKAVAAAASTFAWPFGRANVTAAPLRQGLMRTILGSWSPQDPDEVGCRIQRATVDVFTLLANKTRPLFFSLLKQPCRLDPRNVCRVSVVA